MGGVGRDRRLRDADRTRRRDPRHRAHPLHDQPSEGVHAAPDRRVRPHGQARRPPAPAGAARQRPRPGGDEARLHGARIQEHGEKLRAVRPAISISSDFIVGFPGEIRRRLRADDEADRRSRLRLQLQLPLQPAPRNAGGGAGRRDAAADEKLARLQRLQAAIEANGDAISRARVGTIQRILVEGPSRKDGERADGPHRNATASSTSPRSAAIASGEMVDVRITEVRGHSLRGELAA